MIIIKKRLKLIQYLFHISHLCIPELKYVILGNVRRRNVHQGKFHLGNRLSGKCPFGEMSFAEISVGELSVEEMSVREKSVGDMSIGELSENREKVLTLQKPLRILKNTENITKFGSPNSGQKFKSPNFMKFG